MTVGWARSPFPDLGAWQAMPAARHMGFSLIEALVALVLLAFVLLGIAHHELGTTESVAQARRITEATNLAQMRLEQLANTPFGSIDSGADAANPLRPDGTTGGIYTQTWTVLEDTPATGIKDVTVTVSWLDKDERGSHDDIVELRTLFWSRWP